MKIYTKTGDTGETALIGGQRTSKADMRIQAIGAIDELNASLGYLHSMLPISFDDVAADILHIQHRLFDIGAILANISEKKGRSVAVPELSAQQVAWLEKRIDHYDKDLTQLTAFILPGGTTGAAQAHIARAICRRAERQLVEVQQQYKDSLPATVLKYINRLSDYLFTIARIANRRNQTADIVWQKDISTQ